MTKKFKEYKEAYKLYNDICEGKDPDRKNASIVMTPEWEYLVVWESK